MKSFLHTSSALNRITENKNTWGEKRQIFQNEANPTTEDSSVSEPAQLDVDTGEVTPGYTQRQIRNVFAEALPQVIEGGTHIAYGLAQPILGSAVYSINNAKQAVKDVQIVGESVWDITKYAGKEFFEGTFGIVGGTMGKIRKQFGELFSLSGTSALNFVPKKSWETAKAVVSPVTGIIGSTRNFLLGEQKATNDNIFQKNILSRGSDVFKRNLSNIWKGTRDSINQVFGKGLIRDVAYPTADGVINVGVGTGKIAGTGVGLLNGAIPFFGTDKGPSNYDVSRPTREFNFPPENPSFAV